MDSDLSKQHQPFVDTSGIEMIQFRSISILMVQFGLLSGLLGCSPKESLNIDEPMDVAVCKENADQVRALLSDGADPDMVFADGPAEGFTPLTLAVTFSPQICRKGHNTEVVNVLIEAGADVNKRADIYGGTRPLLEATRAGGKDSVRILLNRGADPNFTDDGGHTPLMVIGSPMVEVMKMLIDGGADATLVARDGKTALSNAIILEKPEYISLIKAAIKEHQK